jgi:predicted alpha/beta-fold hydrolase
VIRTTHRHTAETEIRANRATRQKRESAQTVECVATQESRTCWHLLKIVIPDLYDAIAACSEQRQGPTGIALHGLAGAWSVEAASGPMARASTARHATHAHQSGVRFDRLRRSGSRSGLIVTDADVSGHACQPIQLKL